MSVINQMLRDLDKQQRGAPAVSARNTHSPSAKGAKIWWLIVLMLLVIVGQQVWLPNRTITESAAPPETPQAENTGAAGQNLAPTAVGKNADLESIATKAEIQAKDLAALQMPKAVLNNESPLDTGLHSAANKPETNKTDASAQVEQANVVPANETAANTTPTHSEQQIAVALTQGLETSTTSVQADDVGSAVTVVENQPSEATTQQAGPPEKPAGTAQVQRLSPEQQQQLWQQQAEQALAEGRFEEAEQVLRQLRMLDPHQALPLLAELFWQRQQGLQLDAVLAESRDLGVIDIRLARLALYRLQQQQRWTELLALIDEPLINSYGAEVVALKAQALWQTQQYQPALVAYQHWTTLAPTEARAWLGQALVLEQLAQPKQARLAYQQALQHGGLSPVSLQFIQQRLVALPE